MNAKEQKSCIPMELFKGMLSVSVDHTDFP